MGIECHEQAARHALSIASIGGVGAKFPPFLRPDRLYDTTFL
jgi:hypothetical protein